LDPKLIKRINELSRKSKKTGLTEIEKLEQQQLRRVYIDSFKNNLRTTLENIVLVDEFGNESPVRKQ
jgi:uncharacterized protein YnzC (UPF0291/DUF896 family)